jgi:hypothetical protein
MIEVRRSKVSGDFIQRGSIDKVRVECGIKNNIVKISFSIKKNFRSLLKKSIFKIMTTNILEITKEQTKFF